MRLRHDDVCASGISCRSPRRYAILDMISSDVKSAAAAAAAVHTIATFVRFVVRLSDSVRLASPCRVPIVLPEA